MRRKIFGASFWDLVDAFFAAAREYDEIHYLYELRVLTHAEEQGVDREWLRLEADEVSKLLDFEKLGALRSGPLHRTKEVSHSLFRQKGRTHKFDRYISEIFHDLSILREEQYKVSTFAEEYRLANEMAEYESLLDEVHEDFPRRVHGIQALFAKAQLELEGVLRAHRSDPLYLRSLYLFGDEVFRRIQSYPQGKQSHCWQVFPGGPAEACLLAARSFAQGGFKPQALAVVEEAIKLSQVAPPYGFGDAKHLAELHRQAVELEGVLSSYGAVALTALDLEVAAPHTGDDAAPDLDVDQPQDEPYEDISDELATWAS
ncbi:MAG: hypothetical protein AB7N76_31880 [Planctomycetota bacterium]